MNTEYTWAPQGRRMIPTQDPVLVGKRERMLDRYLSSLFKITLFCYFFKYKLSNIADISYFT